MAKIGVNDFKKSKDGTKNKRAIVKGTITNTKTLKGGKQKQVVHDLADIRVLNVDLVSDYNKLTAELWRFMRNKEANNKLVDVTYKNGWVHYKRYKMQYSSNGFAIIDVHSFSRIVKHSLEPLPTSEQVYTLVNSLGVDKVAIKAKKEKEKVRVNELVQRLAKEVSIKNTETLHIKTVGRLYKELLTDKTISAELKEFYGKKLVTKYPYLGNRKETDFNAQRKKALKFITDNPEVKVIIKKITQYIPNRSFNFKFGKLVRDYEAKQLRSVVFRELLTKYLSDDTIFLEKQYKSAPKFIVKPIFYIDEILSETETHVTFRNDKTGDFTVSKTELLLRDLLYTDPRMHVALYKYYRKELTIEDITKTPFQRDKFVCLDYSEIKEHDPALYEWAEDQLFSLDSLNPLDVLYRNDTTFNIGDTILIRNNEMRTKRKATVYKYENGWKVRYEDGTTDWLYKGQTIKILK